MSGLGGETPPDVVGSMQTAGSVEDQWGRWAALSERWDTLASVDIGPPGLLASGLQGLHSSPTLGPQTLDLELRVTVLASLVLRPSDSG